MFVSELILLWISLVISASPRLREQPSNNPKTNKIANIERYIFLDFMTPSGGRFCGTNIEITGHVGQHQSPGVQERRWPNVIRAVVACILMRDQFWRDVRTRSRIQLKPGAR